MTAIGSADTTAATGTATGGIRFWLAGRLARSETLARALGRGRPDPGTVVLDRNKVFILPTGHGLVLGMVLLVMLIGSVNYNNNLGLSFTFLIGGAVMVSILHTYRNLAGLGFRPGRVEPVFAGGRAGFGLCIDNQAGPERYAITLRTHDGFENTIDLAAGSRQCPLLERQASRRGRLPLGRVAVETRYPLGLFRAWSWLEPVVTCLVYPGPDAATGLPPSNRGQGRDGHPRGLGSDDFIGLRGYRPGDSPGQVYWKAVARELEPQTKLFSGTGGAELWLDWDDTAALPGVEARLSRLCRWVLDAEKNGARYGLSLPGIRLEPARGARHRAHCLESLALFGDQDFGDHGVGDQAQAAV